MFYLSLKWFRDIVIPSFLFIVAKENIHQIFFDPKLIFVCLTIHFKNFLTQTRWKSDVPRIFMVKNTFSHFFVSFWRNIIVTSHGNW